MAKKMSVAVLAVVLALLGAGSAYAKEKTYAWNGYEFSYPNGWTVSQENDIPESGRAVVVSQGKEALEVVIGFMDKLSAEDVKKEKVTPAKLAMALGIPMALKLAGKKESAISISYGSIGLSDGRVLSTRFTVALPDIPDVYNIECFSTTTASKLYAGAIKSSSRKGHVPEDNASYRKAFLEAYAIVKSITVKTENEKAKEAR